MDAECNILRLICCTGNHGQETRETCLLLTLNGQCISFIHLLDRNILRCLITLIDYCDSKIVASILVICNTERVLVYFFGNEIWDPLAN